MNSKELKGAAREFGADLVGILDPGSLRGRLALFRHGFLPTPRRFPIVGKSLAGATADDPVLSGAAAPRFTLGDMDFL